MEARPLSELFDIIDLVERRKRDEQQWKHVGSQLRSLRRVTGYSQAAVADAAGIQQAYLSEIENNVKTPSTNTVESVTTALQTLTSGGAANGKTDGSKARKPSAKADAKAARRNK